jgi:hypothetical protein
MEMELEFARNNFNQLDPTLLADHIQKMALEETPYFPATLSLVYGKLFNKAFPTQTINPEEPLKAQDQAVTVPSTHLRCRRCGGRSALRYLYKDKYCPTCRRRGFLFLVSTMRCGYCESRRFDKKGCCRNKTCQAKFHLY